MWASREQDLDLVHLSLTPDAVSGTSWAQNKCWLNEYMSWSACFFPYHLLRMIPNLSFTPCNLSFLSVDLSVILAKPMRSFCSLDKLPVSHLYIFAGLYWLFLNADPVKPQSFFTDCFMYVVRLPVEVIWQLCHLGAIEVFDVPPYLRTSCDGAILPVSAVRRGMKYFALAFK